MTQLAFQRVGPEDPWVIEAPENASVLFTRTLTTINWSTGAPDIIPDHLAVVVYGGTTFPDATLGVPYIIFTVQGAKVWYAATIDNAQAMDTLVGAGNLWGIAFWWDGSTQPEDWIQY